MTRFRTFALYIVIIATVLLPTTTYAGCMLSYMNDLERCYHTRDFGDQTVCFFDADLDYIGCIKTKILI
ncbi:MAG TPA: hypothetical protein VGF48_15680 [Thermoanaerobaculia bacterium]